MNHKNTDTRERLLTHAEALIARKGYHAVSIREITSAAKCNLASVNYHFGNKKQLYLAVFAERWVSRATRLRSFFEKDLAKAPQATPRAVFRSLANAFLSGPLTDKERLYHAQLIQREMTNPTEAFDLIAEGVMKPFFSTLAGHLQPYMPPEMSDEQMILNLLSMFGMVLYFNFARAAVTRMTGRAYDAALKERLMHHIAEFALQGFGIQIREQEST